MLEKVSSLAPVRPADFNKLVEYINRVTDIKVSPPLEIGHNGGGTQLRVISTGFYATITDRLCVDEDGVNRHWYSVAEVIQVEGGGWELLDNGRVLTAPDYQVFEWNDSPVPLDTVVFVEQSTAALYEWRFQHCCGTEYCSSSSSSRPSGSSGSLTSSTSSSSSSSDSSSSSSDSSSSNSNSSSSSDSTSSGSSGSSGSNTSSSSLSSGHFVDCIPLCDGTFLRIVDGRFFISNEAC